MKRLSVKMALVMSLLVWSAGFEVFSAHAQTGETVELTYVIPTEKYPRIVNAIVGFHPVPEDDDGNPLFTRNQWAKEYIRRLIIRKVHAWERQQMQKQVESDTTLLLGGN